MSLANRIDTEIKQAMLQKDAARLAVLRFLKSGLKYHVIEKQGAAGQATDEDVIIVARKEIKKREEAIETYIKGNRPELAAKEQKEIEIYKEFLPPPLSDSEIEALVKKVITETGASSKTQMGMVMKALQTQAAGRIEGKVLSQWVQKLLP